MIAYLNISLRKLSTLREQNMKMVVSDIACQDFKNRLATSVRGYITPVTIYSWNQSTQGTHISREIFLLSRAEVAEISSNTEQL